MANIRGIQLKSVKTLLMSDGYAITANVYLNNKKAGDIEDEGNGGEMMVRIDKSYDKSITDIVSNYYKECPKHFIDPNKGDYGQLLEFVEEVLELHETEKTFKSNTKKGYPITLVLSTHKREENPFGKGMKYKSPIMVGVKTWDDKMEKYIKEQYKDYSIITPYKSLDDFIIK